MLKKENIEAKSWPWGWGDDDKLKTLNEFRGASLNKAFIRPRKIIFYLSEFWPKLITFAKNELEWWSFSSSGDDEYMTLVEFRGVARNKTCLSFKFGLARRHKKQISACWKYK